MAQLNYTVDTNMPTGGFDVLPKGNYLSMVIDSQIKPTKSGSGEYLQLTLEVIDGPYKGRKVFDRLNIRNQNKIAEKIAMESLNALCVATNVTHLTDSEQLHNIPVLAAIDIESGRGEYDDQNRVKAYKPAGSVATAPAPRPAAVSQAAPATAGRPVWKRSAASA